MAAGDSVHSPARRRELFDELMSLVAGRFRRVEPRRGAREFMTGLLSPLQRKDCWSLAEQAGHGDPQAMQRLLRSAVCDAGLVITAVTVEKCPVSEVARTNGAARS